MTFASPLVKSCGCPKKSVVGVLPLDILIVMVSVLPAPSTIAREPLAKMTGFVNVDIGGGGGQTVTVATSRNELGQELTLPLNSYAPMSHDFVPSPRASTF